MTKFTVIGEEPKEEVKKPTMFVKVVKHDLIVGENYAQVHIYDNVELIAPSAYAYQGERLDVMFAYGESGRSNGIIAFGHWNDGV